jgi:hypothetical protein
VLGRGQPTFLTARLSWEPGLLLLTNLYNKHSKHRKQPITTRKCAQIHLSIDKCFRPLLPSNHAAKRRLRSAQPHALPTSQHPTSIGGESQPCSTHHNTVHCTSYKLIYACSLLSHFSPSFLPLLCSRVAISTNDLSPCTPNNIKMGKWADRESVRLLYFTVCSLHFTDTIVGRATAPRRHRARWLRC